MIKTVMTLVLLAFVFLALAPQKAEARGMGMEGWLLEFDLSYISAKEEETTTSSSSSSASTTYYDINLGYVMMTGLYLGGMYSTKNYSSSSSASVSTSTSATAMGPTLGYTFSNGAFVNATYFISATDQDYKKGSGLGLDFGWRTFMSSSFYVGAKVIYRSLKYTENTTIGNFQSRTRTDTLPYLVFGFLF